MTTAPSLERVENLVRLNLTPGIGPVTVHRLIQAFGHSDAFLGASEEDLLAVEGVTPHHIKAIRDSIETDPRPEIEQACERDVQLLAYDDPRYPTALREMYDPPYLLYVKGRIEPQDSVSIAIVGTRRASHYGREQAERFGMALGRAGFTVISGLARGVDSLAHRGALSVGARTLAVVGSGLGHVYPPENRDLAAEIGITGAVISEFPMDLKPSKDTFPRRNRIVAGMSLGVLVVEAPVRSGALITARLANEMGREVFAIPGRIDQDNAAGCHRLLRNGATLVRNLDDILDELGPLPDAIAAELEESAEAVSLDPKEESILAVLSKDPAHLDHICAQTGLPVQEVSAALMMLELKRRVQQQPGKFFVLK